MKKITEKRYRIIIASLVAIIIIQGLFIFKGRPTEKRIARVAPPIALKGRIAIIIDDWGYNLNNLPIVERIHYPFTASVLPNLAYSGRVAEELHKRGLEIILHLPMEPREKYRLEKNTIMTTFDTADIKDIIEDDLSSVVYAKGVSNHMGSEATRDITTMDTVLKELKKRRLYFLDSFVSADSVCATLARKIGVRFARRDVFLDNKEDYSYIRQQMQRLKSRAKSKGQAIGIGHDRKATLEVLAELMPEFEKEGYKFVFVSELAR